MLYPSVRTASLEMPDATTLACTAFIALAFCDWASFGSRARVSTAATRNARSGARRTTASPVVTMLGTCGDAGGSWADTGAAKAKDADSARAVIILHIRF